VPPEPTSAVLVDTAPPALLDAPLATRALDPGLESGAATLRVLPLGAESASASELKFMVVLRDKPGDRPAAGLALPVAFVDGGPVLGRPDEEGMPVAIGDVGRDGIPAPLMRLDGRGIFVPLRDCARTDRERFWPDTGGAVRLDPA
jgi:hypothetical protein